MKQVGTFSGDVITKLQLNIIPGTPIYIGDSNEEYIKNKHPYKYDKYYNKIPDIISSPDYIGLNPREHSIQYVKKFRINSEYIRVAIRITRKHKCFVKTLHLLSTHNAERYIIKGTQIPTITRQLPTLIGIIWNRQHAKA